MTVGVAGATLLGMEQPSTGAPPRPEFLFGEMVAKIIYAAAELRIPDLVGERARSCAELAERTGTLEQPLRRLLRALAGLASSRRPRRIGSRWVNSVVHSGPTRPTHSDPW
jgi:hypothetical protein